MRGIKIFSSDIGIFSKKEIKRRQKIQKEKVLRQQRILKQRFKEEEKKRKLINKLRKNHSKEILEIQKEELKKIRAKKERKQEKKEIKKMIKKEVSIKKPTLLELENHLLKLSDDYDHGIHKSKKIYEELVHLGLTNEGLKEFKGESIKKREKRISKINEIHKVLMSILESNKELEQRIEMIDDQIKKEQYR